MQASSFHGPSGIMLSDDSQSVYDSRAEKDSTKYSETSEAANERHTEKRSKKKKGRSSGGKTVVSETTQDNEDYVPAKSKKNQKKGKDSSSLQMSDSKVAGRKDSTKMQEEDVGVPSEEWVIQKLLTLVPDFEEHGL